MNDKDLILRKMISNPKRSSDSFFTPESLNTVVLKDRNRDEIEFLIKQIIKEKPELIRIEKVGGIPFAISPTGLVESFLKKGGFEKIELELKERNDLELRKSIIDLKLAEETLKEFPRTKWFARIGFFIAAVLMLKELFIWIYK